MARTGFDYDSKESIRKYLTLKKNTMETQLELHQKVHDLSEKVTNLESQVNNLTYAIINLLPAPKYKVGDEFEVNGVKYIISYPDVTKLNGNGHIMEQTCAVVFQHHSGAMKLYRVKIANDDICEGYAWLSESEIDQYSDTKES